METESKDIVSEVFCDVLEKLAYMFGESIPKEDFPGTGADYVQAAMTFSGPMTGKLTLAVPRAMSVEVAANVLGMEPGDELVETRSSDAIKEMLNVICGHVLTAVAGEEPVFELSAPTLEALDEANRVRMLNEEDTACFLVDDHPVLLRFSWEELSKLER
ncbi:chemotaxis protein CheX [Candidatus Poribacteria bacterium]|nr:chemotaxis protein CheX [Candidatus Poribacteria bacterium]